MSRKDGFDDILPFDQLDPCCQKEIENSKKQASITSILRKDDRSYRRVDLKKNAMTTLKNTKNMFGNCNCCQRSSDYPLLSSIRSTSIYCSDVLSNETSDQKDFGLTKDEIDTDDEDFEMDDFLSEYEQERLQEMEEFNAKVTMASKLGFGSHLEDSYSHVSSMLSRVPSLVLHEFDSSSPLCARVDFALEKLAQKFAGTIFRRVAVDTRFPFPFSSSTFTSSSSLSSLSSLSSVLWTPSQHPRLSCFVDGVMLTSTDDLTRFAFPDSRRERRLLVGRQVEENVNREIALEEEKELQLVERELTLYLSNVNVLALLPEFSLVNLQSSIINDHHRTSTEKNCDLSGFDSLKLFCLHMCC